jgi:Kef-type K+ transport system membrane component KefB
VPQIAGHFFVQVVVVLAACRAVGWLGKRVGQPQVVGEMVAGLLLGPSLLGLVVPGVQQWLFPADSRAIIYVCAQVGLVLYMFLMGATFRVDLALGRAKAAAAVSLAGIVAPFALGTILAWGLHGDRELFPEGVTLAQAAMFMGAAMSITAFPMLARIIEEQGLAGTQLGALALAAASLDDVLAWCALAVVMASGGGGEGGWWIAVRAIGGGAVFVLVVLYVPRPLLKRLGEGLTNTKVDSVWPISPARLAVVLVLLFAAAWCTDAIGVHAVFGAFFFGLAMPRGEFGQRLHRMVGPVTTAFLLPMFFVCSGLNTRIGLIGTWQLAAVTVLVLVVACVGKFAACSLAARLSRAGSRESLAIGALMNARGMTGLIILNIGLERGILTPTLFSIGVVMAVATTLMATPGFRMLYGGKPEVLPELASGAEREHASSREHV